METKNSLDIRPLSGALWLRARENARSQVRKQLIAPDKEEFLAAARDSKYPPSVRNFGFALLIGVTIAAFFVSAGKQVIAADILFQELAAVSRRIVPDTVSAGIVALLALAEFSVIAFGYGAKVSLSEHSYLLLGRIEFNAGRMLRVLQVISMTIAVGGNLTAFGLTYNPSIWLYDLLITLAAPATTIGVGLMIENVVSESITQRANALSAYTVALGKYKLAYDSPETDNDWSNVWGQCVFDLLRMNTHNRPIIDNALAEEEERIAKVGGVSTLYQDIVSAEFLRHMRTFVIPSGKPGNPNSQKFPNVGNGGNPSSQPPTEPGIPVPIVPNAPKKSYAVQHLLDTPEHMGDEWDGRRLEREIPGPDGNRINYHTWNDSKTLVLSMQHSTNGHTNERLPDNG